MVNFALLLAYLHAIGVVPEARAPVDQFLRILEQYRSYLVTERGLAESSIPVTFHVAESLCRTLDHRLEEHSPAEVSAYVAALSARSSAGWSKKTVSALVSFLRFLDVTGITAELLVAALPKLAGVASP